MKYFFWILGCAMNYSDAERLATILESLGYTKTENEKEADLFIVIACSVRESAVLSIYGKVKDLSEYRIKNPEFRTILTGCVLEKDRKKLGKVFDIMMTMDDLSKLPNILNSKVRAPNDKQIRNSKFETRNSGNEYLSVIPKYQSHFRAYVPISTGCNNFCTYCAVPYTKGREKSRPLKEIVVEVENLVKNGYKEITLLGQNVNSYGDKNTFSELVLALDAIPGDHQIYFYSNHPKDMSNELIATLATLEHFPHYIHLPLQSGNDEIIRAMNRHYTKAQYLELVTKIRVAMPDVNLTTDIIVGFPGETEAQFADTMDVMDKAEYDMAFIAQYSPRPGTVSARMADDVPKVEKVRREKALQQVVTKTVLKHNERLVGSIQRVLVDEAKNCRYYGRTLGYKVVEIETDQTLAIGQFIDVRIESVSSWKLVGTLI